MWPSDNEEFFKCSPRIPVLTFRSGIQMLLEHNGVSEQQIDKVVIAGAFGSYIDLSNSIAIGLLPSLSLDRFRQVGNAAGTGAKLALVSMNKRSHVREISDRTNYIELATYPTFQTIFTQACDIGPILGRNR